LVSYILHKIGYSILVLLGVLCLVFFIFNVLPVDATTLTIGQSADEETQTAIRKELGLDKSKASQFLFYLRDLSPVSLHENSIENQEKYQYKKIISIGEKAIVTKVPYLRRSYQTKRPVIEILTKAIPQTLLLTFFAIILASFIGIVFGSIGAFKQNSWIDQFLTFLSTLGVSVPSFFSALVIGFLLGNVWANFTGLNQTGSLISINNLGERELEWKNLILPAIALGVRPISVIYQLTRSSMLDVLSKDYIRTAYAKGLSERRVIFIHALRNAMNPVVTSITGWFASLLAGAFFVEVIFDIKGIGYVTIDAMQKFDFPVAMGAILIIAFVFVLANIIADVFYAILDPRVR